MDIVNTNYLLSLLFLCHLVKANLRLVGEVSIGLPLSHVPMAAGISFMSHTRGEEFIQQAPAISKIMSNGKRNYSTATSLHSVHVGGVLHV